MAPGELAFYRNDFALTVAEPWFIPAASWELAAPPEAPQELATPSDDLVIGWEPLARDGFAGELETVLAGLGQGRWTKAVLAVPEIGRLISGDAATVARRALHAWRQQLSVPSTFGAPLGVQWSGGMQMVVTIRGLWWEQDAISLPAGCGIVDGSELEQEWRELGLKRRWVKQAFGLDA